MQFSSNIVYHISADNTLLLINLENSRLFKIKNLYLETFSNEKLELLPKDIIDLFIEGGIIIE